MIDMQGLSKRFRTLGSDGADRDVIAADRVDIRCEDGQITGLLGPNGAGKTTLLRMLGGLLHPDAGRALIDGLNPSSEPFDVRRILALLPDARGLYPRLTAREHIEYFADLHAVPHAEIAGRIDELAADLEMRDLLARRVAGFSQGERMKVILARALVHRPHNIVLDEPTNGLDVMSARAVRDLVRRLRDEGRCILLSSHLMHEVAQLCDCIYVMAAGRIVARGTAAELLEQTESDDLEDAFVSLVARDLQATGAEATA